MSNTVDVQFDFYKVKHKQVSEFMDKEKTDEDVIVMLSLVSGKPKEFFDTLPWPEWVEVIKKFYYEMSNPVKKEAEKKVEASEGGE